MNRENSPSDAGRTDRSGDNTRWVYVATAPDQLVAELWQQVMREERIPSMLAPEDTVSFLGVSAIPVRLMVPAEMKTRAEEALANLRDWDPAQEADDGIPD